MKPEGSTAEITAPDAGQIVVDDLPERRLPALAALNRTGFRVAVARGVMDDVISHGKSSLDAEVCGILLGTVYRDDDGPWCFIEASVRGNYASGRQTQVTITSETWTHVNEVKDRLFPDKQFVGWYHTHPGFGIFLSGMDDFIQANFFREPWQLAMVYDPKSEECGVFIWRNGKTENEPFILVDERPDAAAAEVPATPPQSAALPSGTAADLSGRLQLLEDRQRWTLVALGFLGLVAVVWPLVVFIVLPMLTAPNKADTPFQLPPPLNPPPATRAAGE